MIHHDKFDVSSNTRNSWHIAPSCSTSEQFGLCSTETLHDDGVCSEGSGGIPQPHPTGSARHGAAARCESKECESPRGKSHPKRAVRLWTLTERWLAMAGHGWLGPHATPQRYASTRPIQLWSLFILSHLSLLGVLAHPGQPRPAPRQGKGALLPPTSRPHTGPTGRK